jgi:hypothetical protein
MVEVKGVSQKTAIQAATQIRFASHVPVITDDQLSALLERSGDARDLDKKIRAHAKRGRLITGSDVEEMLGRAYKRDGKPKTECAAVVAYYAQNKPRLFSADAVPHIVEYVEKVDKAEWSRLVADLEAFIERLNEQRKLAEKEAELKKLRDKDDREYVQKTKIDPQKANGTKAERAAELKKAQEKKTQEKRDIQRASDSSLTDDITNGGQLTLSEVEQAQLLMLKKGFANRE